jgi:hypothetical protein
MRIPTRPSFLRAHSGYAATRLMQRLLRAIGSAHREATKCLRHFHRHAKWIFLRSAMRLDNATNGIAAAVPARPRRGMETTTAPSKSAKTAPGRQWGLSVQPSVRTEDISNDSGTAQTDTFNLMHRLTELPDLKDTRALLTPCSAPMPNKSDRRRERVRHDHSEGYPLACGR